MRHVGSGPARAPWARRGHGHSHAPIQPDGQGRASQGGCEDCRCAHLAQDLRPRLTEGSLILGHADALAAAALGRLEHHRVADAAGRVDCL
eukprot:3546178-Prymnesium_polylepis.1